MLVSIQGVGYDYRLGTGPSNSRMRANRTGEYSNSN